MFTDKTRIVIFVNNQGFTCARNTRNFNRDAWAVEKFNLQQRGFTELDSFIIPARLPRGSGWNVYYRKYLNFQINRLGL